MANWTSTKWPPLIFPVGIFIGKVGGFFTPRPAPPMVLPQGIFIGKVGGFFRPGFTPPFVLPVGTFIGKVGGFATPRPAPPSVLPAGRSATVLYSSARPATPTVNYTASVAVAQTTRDLFRIVQPTYPTVTNS